jgi:hypothetical protein
MSETSNILVLDIEGTLVSNASSVYPRPGLKDFLMESRELFHEIVIYSGISHLSYENVKSHLIENEFVPSWFSELRFFRMEGRYKDLLNIRTEIQNVFIVDDMELFIHPEQKAHWIEIKPFQPPYPADDNKLFKVFNKLKAVIE